MKKRYFDDLKDGEHLHCQPVVMNKEAIIDFGNKFDPQPFHIDENAVSESLFGGLVTSSLHTLSACTRVVVEAQENVAILSGVVCMRQKCSIRFAQVTFFQSMPGGRS